jgi:hypothetical protein
LSNIRSIDKQFSGLFEAEIDKSGDTEERGRGNDNGFMQRFGWTYQATIIAEHERIKLEEVYGLSTIQCLNALSYLKAKNAFDKDQINKINAKY